MNAIKRFFKNFGKQGSIYQVSGKVKCALSTENYSDEEDTASVQTDVDNKTNKEETSEELGQENKDTGNAIQIDEDLKLRNPHSEEFKEVENSAADDDARTKECLKEFDEIVDNFSKDITVACASFDEIEDAINNINKEDRKDSLFEIPRFDLLDLIPSFDSVDESLEDSNTILLDEVDLTLEEPMDLDEINETTEFDTDETINLNNTEHMDYKEIDTELEVISISSEDNEELKDANVKNEEPKKGESEHAAKNVNKENAVLIEEHTKVSENVESNVKFVDSPSIDSDDCGYHSSDFEFITEEEAKMNGLIINVSPDTLKTKVKKPKRVKIGIDQFSERGNSSKKIICSGPSNGATEFKTVHPGPDNLSNNLDTRQDNNKFTKTNSNIQANCFGQNNGKSPLRNVRRIRPQVDIHHSNMGETDFVSNYLDHTMKCTQINNQLEISNSGSDSISEINNLEPMQVDCPEIKTDKIQRDNLKNLQYGSGLNNLGYGPSDSQRNNTDVIFDSDRSTNSLEPTINKFGPSIQENSFGNVPSHVSNSPGVKQLGFSNMQNNCPKTPDPRYEKWRTLRARNQNQIVLDHSYRNNHRVLDNEEYYRLFDPNFGPLLNQNMRQMENKSTMSTSMMLVEYEGVGFDMQMMREWSESEEDEVKEEADASTRKILDMYPGENEKRLRRF